MESLLLYYLHECPIFLCEDYRLQGSPNVSIRGPHKLLHNSQAPGHLT